MVLPFQSTQRMLQTSIAALIGGMVAGCVSTQPVAVGENTYFLPPLELSVKAPAAWQVVSATDVRAAQKHPDSTNETLNAVVYQSANVSFLTLARAEPLRSDLHPVFSIYRESLGEARFAPSERFLGFAMHSYLEILVGARVVSPAVTVTIGRQQYAYGRIIYPLSFRDGTKVLVERRFWVRASPLSAVVMTMAFDSRDAAQIEPEIQELLGSIQPARSGISASDT